MAGPETVLTNKIIKAVRARRGTWIRKIHGNRFTAGIPDLVCCEMGKFFAFEVKAPGRPCKGSALQEAEIDKIRQADGYALVVNTVEQVIDTLDAALEGY